jgi:nucleoside-diphosphate-sugar epimerase
VNLATGRLTAIREFVETAAQVLDIDPERLQFGSFPMRAGEMHHLPVTVQRLDELTGWRPATRIAEGIARTRDFRRQHAGEQDE